MKIYARLLPYTPVHFLHRVPFIHIYFISLQAGGEDESTPLMHGRISVRYSSNDICDFACNRTQNGVPGNESPHPKMITRIYGRNGATCAHRLMVERRELSRFCHAPFVHSHPRWHRQQSYIILVSMVGGRGLQPHLRRVHPPLFSLPNDDSSMTQEI